MTSNMQITIIADSAMTNIVHSGKGGTLSSRTVLVVTLGAVGEGDVIIAAVVFITTVKILVGVIGSSGVVLISAVCECSKFNSFVQLTKPCFTFDSLLLDVRPTLLIL